MIIHNLLNLLDSIKNFSSFVMSIRIGFPGSSHSEAVHMSEALKVPPLPDEYEAMFNDTIKDVKEIVMKIRGNLKANIVLYISNFISLF